MIYVAYQQNQKTVTRQSITMKQKGYIIHQSAGPLKSPPLYQNIHKQAWSGSIVSTITPMYAVQCDQYNRQKVACCSLGAHTLSFFFRLGIGQRKFEFHCDCLMIHKGNQPHCQIFDSMKLKLLNQKLSRINYVCKINAGARLVPSCPKTREA